MYHELKCFRGSKQISLKTQPPLLLLNVNQNAPGSAFTEHFIFTGLESHPFIHRSTGFGTGHNVSAPEFDENVTKEALLSLELESAKAHFEFSIFQANKTIHDGFFWSGGKFTFDPVEENAVLYWMLRQELKGHFDKMVGMTQSLAMNHIKALWRVASRIAVQSDPH